MIAFYYRVLPKPTNYSTIAPTVLCGNVMYCMYCRMSLIQARSGLSNDSIVNYPISARLRGIFYFTDTNVEVGKEIN